MVKLDFKVTQIETVQKRSTPIVKTFDDFLNDNIKGHKPTIERIRSSTDKALVNNLKKTLPACQFCISNGHGISGINQHSNIMQIDIDAKDNFGICDLKSLIASVPYIFYAMNSASGKGVFALVRIESSKQYKEHFDAFRLYIEGSIHIKIDSAVSSPASPRFWSYDEYPFFNKNAQVWNYIPKPQATPKRSNYNTFGVRPENSPFDDYNKNGDIEKLLLIHGWTYQPNYNKGTRRRYSRPGKEKGVSADWCIERRILYVFSNAVETGIANAGKGYNSVSVYCQLQCNGNMKLCATKLRAMGYGRVQY